MTSEGSEDEATKRKMNIRPSADERMRPSRNTFESEYEAPMFMEELTFDEERKMVCRKGS